MHRLALALVAAVWGASCLMSDARCPCGQEYDQDPFGAGRLDIGADHDESVHCFCRCGDGPTERLDPAADCDDYEGTCRDRAGQPADYVCD